MEQRYRVAWNGVEYRIEKRVVYGWRPWWPFRRQTVRWREMGTSCILTDVWTAARYKTIEAAREVAAKFTTTDIRAEQARMDELRPWTPV